MHTVCHTKQLEPYHSLRLKYCPKRSLLSVDVMETHGALAALDHNFNVGRKQAGVNRPSAASDAAGAIRFAPYHSKRTKDGLLALCWKQNNIDMCMK